MKITVNGREHDVDEQTTITAVLRQMQLDRDGIAVAVGMQVVPRTEHETHRLHEGDRVEVIRAVGGG